ncbi:MAG: hypothetical protein J3K34DRAFT_430622 [Monoraphidium minutum]|nr:MAG: hypothetical protein J3K34DRAFT_430622 [Monoraphidium minutum]
MPTLPGRPAPLKTGRGPEPPRLYSTQHAPPARAAPPPPRRRRPRSGARRPAFVAAAPFAAAARRRCAAPFGGARLVGNSRACTGVLAGLGQLGWCAAAATRGRRPADCHAGTVQAPLTARGLEQAQRAPFLCFGRPSAQGARLAGLPVSVA